MKKAWALLALLALSMGCVEFEEETAPSVPAPLPEPQPEPFTETIEDPGKAQPLPLFSESEYADYKVFVGLKETEYDVTVVFNSSDGKAYNGFGLYWYLPEGAEVTLAEDSFGKTLLQSADGNGFVLLESRDGPPRKQELMKLKFTAPSDANDLFSPLAMHDLFFYNLPNSRTSVVAGFEEKLAGVGLRGNAALDEKNNSVSLEGEGPLSLGVVTASETPAEFKHYKAFPQRIPASSEEFLKGVKEGDEWNQMIPRILGHAPKVTKFPVVGFPEAEFSKRFGEVAGAFAYTSYGFIVMRENAFRDPNTKEFAPYGVASLLHETAHAYNAQLVTWAKEGIPAWFDEGTAEYVALVVEDLQGRRRELFGSETSYIEGDYVYTLSPDGDRERLWSYYIEGKDSILDWDPARLKVADEISMNYSLAKFIFVSKEARDNAFIQKAYKTGRTNREPVEGGEEFLEAAGMKAGDLTPCRESSFEAFTSCVKNVNANELRVPSSAGVAMPSSESFGEVYGEELDFESVRVRR
ncbi:MAG TPA: hypothetical protein VJI67_03445 [archaeon]|nr:hypothetical protein [archaeon]HLD81314.1 hypothetical protein [archaeon]